MQFKEVIAVYSQNHTKHVNTKCSVIDCESRWYIYLPFGLKGLMWYALKFLGFRTSDLDDFFLGRARISKLYHELLF
jgi:hypothetical protein